MEQAGRGGKCHKVGFDVAYSPGAGVVEVEEEDAEEEAEEEAEEVAEEVAVAEAGVMSN